jgi:NDP-sugar pyrophosphorylase family protein
MSDQIVNYFKDGFAWGGKIRYSYEPKAMGTAGGVKKIEKYFKNETFLVIGGDDLTDIDLTSVLSFHRQKKAVATIALKRVEDPSLYGVVQTNESGRITRFQEKPSKKDACSNMINTGIYIFEPEVLELIPKDTFYDFGKQLFPLLLEKNLPFYACPAEGYWCDVGDIHQYRSANFAVLKEELKAEFFGTQIKPGIWIGEGTKIADTAILQPPVSLGEGVIISSKVKVTGPVVLGVGCVIEKGAEVENSILLGENVIGEAAAVNDSILGKGYFIEAGEKCLQQVLDNNKLEAL